MPKERSVRVAGSDVARDFGALFEVAANGEIGGRGAGMVALLEGAVTAVEARDHAVMTLAIGRFGIDQGLGLVAPFLALLRAANGAQEMQSAEDFGKPLQVAVVGYRDLGNGHLRAGRPGGKTKGKREDGQSAKHRSPASIAEARPRQP